MRTYPTNGLKIKALRLQVKDKFPTVETFCHAAEISPPTLRSLEKSRPAFADTLMRIAAVLPVKSWIELTTLTKDQWPTGLLRLNKDSRLVEMDVNTPFESFDETTDGKKIVDALIAILKTASEVVVIRIKAGSVKFLLFMHVDDYLHLVTFPHPDKITRLRIGWFRTVNVSYSEVHAFPLQRPTDFLPAERPPLDGFAAG